MNFILEQALRAGLCQLIGHAVPPSVAGAHPNLVRVENAWIDQVMAYVEKKRKDFPMPPSWLLINAVMPEVGMLIETVTGIVSKHSAARTVETPVATIPAPSEEPTTPSASEGKE